MAYFVYGYRIFGVPYTKTVSLVYGVGWLEERSDDAQGRERCRRGSSPLTRAGGLRPLADIHVTPAAFLHHYPQN